MKPIDFRNATFEQLQERLTGLRERVYNGWRYYEMAHGTAGATTQAVCDWLAANARSREEAPLSILSFRPRCTELYQDGWLLCVEEEGSLGERSPGVRGARYRTRSADELGAWLAVRRAGLVGRQMQMPFAES